MSFVDTDICKSRKNCYVCRNNEHFRVHMKQRYGDWECPFKIPINAKPSDLPSSFPEEDRQAYIQMMNNHQQMEIARQKRQQQLDELKVVIDELETIAPQARDHINKIRAFLFPTIKSPNACVHGGQKIGEVDQECCGGKIEKVDAFRCNKHMITTVRKCMGCSDFALK